MLCVACASSTSYFFEEQVNYSTPVKQARVSLFNTAEFICMQLASSSACKSQHDLQTCSSVCQWVYNFFVNCLTIGRTLSAIVNWSKCTWKVATAIFLTGTAVLCENNLDCSDYGWVVDRELWQGSPKRCENQPEKNKNQCPQFTLNDRLNFILYFKKMLMADPWIVLVFSFRNLDKKFIGTFSLELVMLVS